MIKLTINNEAVSLEADPQMPLLWALRDLLKLTGTKYGCGGGYCGACTVHMDGNPTRSCMIPLSAAAGKQVLTIEGISKSGNHPVQQAWREENVPQCGYCQSGQIMSSIALLNNNRHPSESDINAALNGNLCRCGTYTRIRKAIKVAAGKINGAES